MVFPLPMIGMISYGLIKIKNMPALTSGERRFKIIESGLLIETWIDGKKLIGQTFRWKRALSATETRSGIEIRWKGGNTEIVPQNSVTSPEQQALLCNSRTQPSGDHKTWTSGLLTSRYDEKRACCRAGFGELGHSVGDSVGT